MIRANLRSFRIDWDFFPNQGVQVEDMKFLQVVIVACGGKKSEAVAFFRN